MHVAREAQYLLADAVEDAFDTPSIAADDKITIAISGAANAGAAADLGITTLWTPL